MFWPVARPEILPSPCFECDVEVPTRGAPKTISRPPHKGSAHVRTRKRMLLTERVRTRAQVMVCQLCCEVPPLTLHLTPKTDYQ